MTDPDQSDLDARHAEKMRKKKAARDKIVAAIGAYNEARTGLSATIVEVRDASDGASGARLAAEGEPDAVLLDLKLTGGTGIEVLRKVCPVAPHIVFIMLTNHPEPQYRKVCLQSGATHFLDKSTEFDKVMDVIAGLHSTH